MRAWTAPTTDGKRRAISVTWQNDRGPEANHTYAARELARKLGWSGEWVGNEGVDHVHVFVRTGCGAPTFSIYEAEEEPIPETKPGTAPGDEVRAAEADRRARMRAKGAPSIAESIAKMFPPKGDK